MCMVANVVANVSKFQSSKTELNECSKQELLLV
jgi:hypothetical protein